MKKTAHVALAFKPTNTTVLTCTCQTYLAPKPDFKDRVSRDSTGDVTTDVEPFARRAADWRHLLLKKKVCKHIRIDDGIQTHHFFIQKYIKYMKIVSSLLKTAMRKRKHDREDSPGIQTQLPLTVTLFQRELTLTTIAYSLFSYISHVECVFFSTGCFQEKH